MRRSISVAIASVLLATCVPAVGAQTGDATIVGTVHDSSGSPLPDITITVRNSSTGFAWSILSNSAGRFAFIQLPLGGPYTVAARRVGFAPESRSGYELTLGRRIVVDLVLRRTTVELPSVVVAERSSDERQSSIGGNLRIGALEIAEIPAVSRNFTDLTSLAPGTGPQLSFLGQRWTSTDFRIDGAQARNMLRAGEFGAGPFTLSMEAIREFQVSSTVYDVTQGRQGGGTVRAATKAGTNTWSGSIFSYYRSSTLGAARDYQERSREQREFGAIQWGGSAGGPIVRDKAHIFLAFDRQDSVEPLFTGLVQTPADEVATGVAADSLDRLIGILSSQYGLDATHPQIGRLDRKPVSNALFARVDWALNEVHRLTLSHSLNSWSSPLSGGVDFPVALFEARSNYRSLEQQSLLAVHSTPANGVQNDLKLSVSSSRRQLSPNSLAPRGFVRIQSLLSNGSTGDTRVQFGGNRLAPDDSRELQLQLINTTHLQLGEVLFSFGTDNTLTSLRTFIAEAQSGLFEFQSLADLELRRAFRYSRTLPLTDNQPTTLQKVLELGAFAQTEWRPSPRLTATVGLRWDGTGFLTRPPRNALVEQETGERTDRAPSDWTRVQPRAQLVWDLDGAAVNIARVGAGVFASQPPYYAQHNQLLNDGQRIADITLSGAAVPVPDYDAYRNDPSTNPGLPTGAPTPRPYVNIIDPDFRMPRVLKASAAYRRQVSKWLAVTGSLVYSRTTDNYTYVDRNLRADAAFTLDNEENRAVFVPANTIDAQGRTLNVNALANPAIGRMLELTNSGRASQRAAIIEVSAELAHGAHLDLSYTWNRARDNSTYGCCLARTMTTFTAIRSDPRDLSGSWGPSDTDFRHKVAISGSVNALWNVRVAGRYVGSTGRPISAVVNGDINGDESTSNDLAFVFDPDDPNTPVAIADAMRRVLENPRNIARDYLRSNLGGIAARNGAYMPWSGRIDLRATRSFPTTGRQAVEVGLDIFNFANLLNSKWGGEYQLPLGISNQNPVVQRIPLLNVVGFNQTTNRYSYSVNENFGVFPKAGNPYGIQLSVRYHF